MINIMNILNMIAITMEYYHQMEKWMELANISKYGMIMSMNLIMDSITKGNLKKVK